jgi:hypothetical protein
MTDIQTEVIKRLQRGQLLTRGQILNLGAANPASVIQALRKQGTLIVYVRAAGEPFWVAPALAEKNGVDWSKRMLAKLAEPTGG